MSEAKPEKRQVVQCLRHLHYFTPCSPLGCHTVVNGNGVSPASGDAVRPRWRSRHRTLLERPGYLDPVDTCFVLEVQPGVVMGEPDDWEEESHASIDRLARLIVTIELHIHLPVSCKVARRVRAVEAGNELRRRGDAVTGAGDLLPGLDRKSTRLNSSHVKISYAAFCLRKKS